MLDYKEFKKAIKAIKKQLKKDKECTKAFEVILNDRCYYWGSADIVQDFIDILAISTDDKYKLIELFVYETDFGKKDYNLTIEKKEVKLDSIKTLYNNIHYFNMILSNQAAYDKQYNVYPDIE